MTGGTAFVPSKGSPVVDQLMAGIGDAERRRGPFPDMTDVLPDFFVDPEVDKPLADRVQLVAEYPLTHAMRNGVLDDLDVADMRPYVRWFRRPEIGYPFGPGWQDHVAAARLAAPRALAYECDRCGSACGPIRLTIALTPPHLVVLALGAACVDEIGVRPYTFEPR